MTSRDIEIHPLAVALRGEQGPVALFVCDFPSQYRGTVSLWATCGQRRRMPVPARVIADAPDASGRRRRVFARVELLPGYGACTLHLAVRDGLRVRRAACRIPESRFLDFAPSTSSAENDAGYHEWFLANRADAAELERQRDASGGFPLRPLISIVTPAFNTPEPFLVKLAESVLGQTYANFEFVVVDVGGEGSCVEDVLARFGDDRVRVVHAPNRTIPENTNVGIAAARGDYIAFVDHDDFLEPDILFRYVQAINDNPDCDLLYCDEDLWVESDGDGRFCSARFKPGWDETLLLSHNYACHMLAVSRNALGRVELSGSEMNGAQDYDLTFKVAEVARNIRHVPGVLYHWREHPGSTAVNRASKPYTAETGRLAVQRHLDRANVLAEVAPGSYPLTYRVRYAPSNAGVSLVLLHEGLDGWERIGGEPPEGVLAEVLACGRRSLNEACHAAEGAVVVVLDGSVSASGAWLEELAGQLSRPQVGCASPLLVTEGGLVAAAGFVKGSDGVWRRRMAGWSADDVGYMLMLEHAHEVSAVPLRCLAFRRSDFERVGGFDEGLSGDWPAVDLCLRLRAEGLVTVLSPYAPVVCGDVVDLPGGSSSDLMVARHKALADGDPCIDPLLEQTSSDFSL